MYFCVVLSLGLEMGASDLFITSFYAAKVWLVSKNLISSTPINLPIMYSRSPRYKYFQSCQLVVFQYHDRNSEIEKSTFCSIYVENTSKRRQILNETSQNNIKWIGWMKNHIFLAVLYIIMKRYVFMKLAAFSSMNAPCAIFCCLLKSNAASKKLF